MSTLEEIESAIEKLPATDQRKLEEWLAERKAREWDRQIERDIQSGRLKKMADDAIRDFKSGKTNPFPA